MSVYDFSYIPSPQEVEQRKTKNGGLRLKTVKRFVSHAIRERGRDE